ncbi:MAG: hypothetical protein ACJ8AW_53470 [Rhodopila sp.]
METLPLLRPNTRDKHNRDAVWLYSPPRLWHSHGLMPLLKPPRLSSSKATESGSAGTLVAARDVTAAPVGLGLGAG